MAQVSPKIVGPELVALLKATGGEPINDDALIITAVAVDMINGGQLTDDQMHQITRAIFHRQAQQAAEPGQAFRDVEDQ
jgi:hypothetical protein